MWICGAVGLLVLFLPFTVSAEPTVTVQLPQDFPVGLPTIFAGDFEGERLPRQVFALYHPKLGGQKLLGQSDEEGRRVWIALTATSGVIGKTIELKGAEVETEPILKTVMVENYPDFETKEFRGAYVFLDGLRPVLLYQAKPVTRHEHTRAGFVHPLRGLDGETFTEIFPEDHRHHQGVFWAWHQLWYGKEKIGDPWFTKDHLVESSTTSETNRGPLFTELSVSAHWTSPLLTSPIVDEETVIRLYRANENTQYVDFTIQLTPRLRDVKIGGSENVKGYSGFTVRVKPPKDLVIQDADGVREQDAVQTSSHWADVSGSFVEGQTSGVGILSHPSLAQFPPRWLLRHYGMQNVAYPGHKPVALSAKRPLVIRHRLVLHRGNTEQARIADHQRVYELTP